MRVVIDTNVIVSAIFFNGLPRKVLEKWMDDQFELICSQDIIEEYIRVFDDFGKKRGSDISKIAANLVIENATIIKVALKRHYSRDPDDDKFINCAQTAEVKYLVSGDNDLLVLKKVDNIEILKPREFLSII